MKSKGCSGSITVFFSLLSMAFLGLIGTAVESVRIQGARAQAVNIAEMGNYSVFGEYEKALLEDYEIFAVDGGYGTGDFSMDRIKERLQKYYSYNTEPKREKIAGWCFEPWQIRLKDCKITEYALLTDQDGMEFYQQAVAYMKATAVSGTLEKLFQYHKDARTAQNGQETYQKEKYLSDQQMDELEKKEEEKKQEKKEQETEVQGALIVEEENQEIVPPENPLKMINRLRKKDLLDLVYTSREISEKSVSNAELVSWRSKQAGTMNLKKKHSGLFSDLLFREYLLGRFPNCLNEETGGKLDYQMEYILCGKKNDRANLKATAQKLLLVREGMNYLYCVSDSEMNAQTGSLAALLIGWTGIPALTSILKHGLLLGWAYGESLVDVKLLLEGGKVPLTKTAQTWQVTLERLARLDQLLEEKGNGNQEGMTYEEYLRILLNLQSVKEQRKRGLNLLELNIKMKNGLSNFQADHCVVGMKETTEWTIAPVFLRIPGALMGIRQQDWVVTADSGFVYGN